MTAICKLCVLCKNIIGYVWKAIQLSSSHKPCLVACARTVASGLQLKHISKYLCSRCSEGQKTSCPDGMHTEEHIRRPYPGD